MFTTITTELPEDITGTAANAAIFERQVFENGTTTIRIDAIPEGGQTFIVELSNGSSMRQITPSMLGQTITLNTGDVRIQYRPDPDFAGTAGIVRLTFDRSTTNFIDEQLDIIVEITGITDDAPNDIFYNALDPVIIENEVFVSGSGIPEGFSGGRYFDENLADIGFTDVARWGVLLGGTDPDITYASGHEIDDVLTFSLPDAINSPFEIIETDGGFFILQLKSNVFLDASVSPTISVVVEAKDSSSRAITETLTFNVAEFPDTIALGLPDSPLFAFDTTTANADRLEGSEVNDDISGGGGDDDIFGRSGDDILNGEAGSDLIVGQGGDDILRGGDGNDFLFGGTGSDTHDGGDGQDTADYSDAAASLTADLAFSQFNTGEALGDTYTSIEALRGTQFDDILSGDAANNVLSGELGNDILNGRAGGDVLNGGLGSDAAIYIDSSARVTVSLQGAGFASGGDAEGDTLVSIENLVGSSFADTLEGDVNDNIIFGGAGSDMIDLVDGTNTALGEGGNDTVQGGASVDNISGGAGADMLFGDGGNDVIDGDSGGDTISGGGDDDTLFGGNGADTLNGGTGNDTLNGEGFTDILNGGAGDDILSGGGSADQLFGDADDDTLSGNNGRDDLNGGSGNDILNGGRDNDELRGGSGNDELLGSTGDDQLYGDDGADTFQFRANHGSDRIFDFEQGTDVIQFNIGSVNDISDLTFTNVFAGVDISYGSGSIRVLGSNDTDFTNADFEFL